MIVKGVPAPPAPAVPREGGAFDPTALCPPPPPPKNTGLPVEFPPLFPCEGDTGGVFPFPISEFVVPKD